MDFSTILSIQPFDWKAIATAIFCGCLIGLERQRRGKPVGIRTSSMICLGTYVFVTASMTISTSVSDPSRIIGQIVTGVGFLGAGVMMTKDGAVMGVTSAATIWVLAAIGVTVSMSSYLTAIKLAIIVVLILNGVELLESYFSSLTRGVHQKFNLWRDKTKK